MVIIAPEERREERQEGRTADPATKYSCQMVITNDVKLAFPGPNSD